MNNTIIESISDKIRIVGMKRDLLSVEYEGNN